MVKPDKIPEFIRSMQSVANKRGLTSYQLRKDTGLPLRTAQRFLAGDLNPTASTTDTIAKALGLTIKIAKG